MQRSNPRRGRRQPSSRWLGEPRAKGDLVINQKAAFGQIRTRPHTAYCTAEYKGKGQRKLIEEQYDAFLADYEVGDYGEAELDEGENRLTVKNRFKAAAARRGLELVFQRTTGNVLRFKVSPMLAAAVEVEAVETEPPVASQPAPKGRGGRRKAAVGTVR